MRLTLNQYKIWKSLEQLIHELTLTELELRLSDKTVVELSDIPIKNSLDLSNATHYSTKKMEAKNNEC